MAKKKKIAEEVKVRVDAPAKSELITEVIEKNYMPYVMSVIVSRAIPEIDGFKPSHRKLLYTMYKMGLLSGGRTKSANIVGSTMRLNPHGDAAIYDTMVRLTRGNEALLHPFIDSKGSFGKQYSRDMAYAASRYTEAKLDSFCAEIFSGIDKNAVEMIPNYDNTTTEPTLLPTTFPNILVSPNMGIAVGMACSICSFNLSEICDATIALLKNPRTNIEKILDLVKAPDFSGGGLLLYDRDKMRELYQSGRGSVKLRARYTYDKQENCIDILQIPYSTTIEVIMSKISELVKEGKAKEIQDFRDEIDLNGFKLTIDLKRGTDPDKLMAKLYKLTALEDTFDCNFNILVDGAPRQMGIIEILTEWIRFRCNCYRRELVFEKTKKEDKLHLLEGLVKILLDIDRAIAIVRGTSKDSDVVPNLMKAFSLDEIQAEYVAEIKLRHFNREYILNRTSEITELQAEIKRLREIIEDELKLKGEIAGQLLAIKKKYGIPRKTQLIGVEDIIEADEDDFIENYNVKVMLTHDGYFKKMTLQSLRGSDEQKLKEGDRVADLYECDNKAELLFFTNKCQIYHARVADFEPVKASALGDYIPAKLSMDDGEKPVMMHAYYELDPSHNIIYIFENGKGVRIPVSAYQTKSNRRKLSGAYSDASPLTSAIYEDKTKEVLLVSDGGKAALIKSSLIPQKSTRTSCGVTLVSLKGKNKLVFATGKPEEFCKDPSAYRKIKIPATPSPLERADKALTDINKEG